VKITKAPDNSRASLTFIACKALYFPIVFSVGLLPATLCPHTRHNSGVLFFAKHQQWQC